jgi:hypothetical protein
LKQTRDTKRISNLKSLNNALSIFQATKPTTSMGTANIVYISIPDSDSSCTNLSLPTLPTGYTYQCSTTDNYKKTDGTGWIPVNFDSLDIGSPLSSLPIDPTNTTSTNLFFTYTTGGSWELNAILESSANKLSGDNDKTSLDGGDSYSTYEIGTDLSLAPYKDTGLVGYWRMDEGTGSTTKDDAASNTGTITGATWKTSEDCASGNCLYFDGVNDYMAIMGISYNYQKATYSYWFNNNFEIANISGKFQAIFSWGTTDYGMFFPVGDSRFVANFRDTLNIQHFVTWVPGSAIKKNQWHQITNVIEADSGYIHLYLDGVFQGQHTDTAWTQELQTNLYLGRYNTDYYNGTIDNFRIYNRALSAAEVKALYEGTK